MQERVVYISFLRKDCPEIEQMVKKLETMGFRVLFDEGIECGSEYDAEKFSEKILDSSCIIVFLSKNAVQSSTILREVMFAHLIGREVVPVFLEDVQLPIELELYFNKSCIVYDAENEDAFFEQLRKNIDDSDLLTELPDDSFYCDVCGRLIRGNSKFCCCCGALNNREKTKDSYNCDVVENNRAPNLPVFASMSPGEIQKNEPSNVPVFASIPPGEIQKRETFTQPVKKRGVKEKIKRVLKGSRMTDVNFSVIVPAMLTKGNYTIVDLYAYEDAFRHVIEKTKVERSRQEGAIKESDGGHLQIRNGTKITVRLISSDVIITDNEESRIWTGKYTKFDFPVFVPEDCKKSQLLFCADVYFDEVIATHIRFIVSCNMPESQQPYLVQNDVRSAFISYASGDRERVSLILQGMRRSRPDLNVFFDVENLKSGEKWENILRKEIDRRDVLYLCWSKLAKESPWVEMEWRYALKNKGLDSIEPIPLELPKDCPPPEELKDKHFSSVELYYK